MLIIFIGSDGWLDGGICWTCDMCGECWEEVEFFKLLE